MQHARFKPHARERTCNPVQRPNFRGRATRGTKRNPKDHHARGPQGQPGKTELRGTMYLSLGRCSRRGSRARGCG
jgi:hypothetical protein